MIDVTWTAFAQIVEWGQSAYAAAQKKGEQRYTRVVENSAILVSGVSTLNRELNGLLQPLAHFDPAEWDQSRRSEHVTRLIRFSAEDTILPRMQIARTTLSDLLVATDDVDVQRTAGEILARAHDLFDPPPDPEPSLARFDPRTHASNTESLLDNAVVQRDDAIGWYHGPDGKYDEYLPRLLERLREAPLGPDPEPDSTDPYRAYKYTAESVRWLAKRLLRVRPDNPFAEEPDTDEDELQGVLFPAAEQMQIQLGRLLAVSQRAFPGMPTPTFTL